MRALAHRMVDDAIDYTRDIRQRPTWQAMDEEALSKFDAPAPQLPQGAQAAYEKFLQDIVPYNMGTPHPRFWAWYMGNGTVLGALADFLAATLNPNLGGGNHAPGRVEEQVVGWLRQMIGFPEEASGLLVSGGSMANFVALSVARNTRAGFDVRNQGLRDQPQLTMYASTEVHSCNFKAVELLGLGRAALRDIPVNPDFTMNLDALGQAIDEDIAQGCRPVAVIASAGTVNTGAIDALPDIAQLCSERDLWFHVDGAIGALAILADNVREQLTGLELADSVALDLHKWMHIPFEAGCIIVRHPEQHKSTFKVSPAYLEKVTRGLASGSTWFSDYGLQLSRQFRALKIWMSVQEHGLQRYGRMIARNVEQAHYLGGLIEQASELELCAPIGLDIVCLRYNPGGLGEAQLNALNRQLLIELQEQGIAAPSYTTLGERYCIRVAIANHRSTHADFRLLIRELTRIGRELNAFQADQ